MERRTYGSREIANPGAANSRILVALVPVTHAREAVSEVIALDDVVTEAWSLLFLAAGFAASNERLAEIFMLIMLGMDCRSFTRKRVSECKAVRSPFGE